MDLEKSLNAFYYSTSLCELKLMNKDFENDKITYNSLLYLELIFNMNGKCTASQIAKLLYVSKPAVTLKINELIKNGLVKKEQNPKDARQNLLSVNEDAVPIFKIYREQDREAISKIRNKFSEEDIDKFCEMLDIISEINFKETENQK